MSVNHLYQVVGRNKPTAKNPTPKIFRMKLFAQNKPIAMSRFWYFLAKLNKSKASTGEILEVSEITEKNTNQVKNFGITLRFNSRSGTHNMYKEYRDTSLNAAIDKMYAELASRHRCRRSSIWIVDTAVVPSSQVKRENVKQFINSGIKFRLTARKPRPSSVAFRKTFKATKPVCFF
jgi:large subunit ribosomal protein L18Ae